MGAFQGEWHINLHISPTTRSFCPIFLAMIFNYYMDFKTPKSQFNAIWANWVKGGGGLCTCPKKDRARHTCLGAGCRVTQANEAAMYPQLTGLCQHELVSGILKNWKQCGISCHRLQTWCSNSVLQALSRIV